MADPGNANEGQLGASLADVVTTMQDQVRAGNTQALHLAQVVPTSTSGQITSSVNGTLVQAGFVRLTGIAVLTTAAIAYGGLYDAPTLAGATAAQQVGVLLTTPGFYGVNMIFAQGLVAKPSTGQIVSLHYARV